MSGQNIECSAGDYGSNIIGQQLFLGSSISSFSSSTGWGGSSSTLTVELVDDYGCLGTGSSLEPIFKGDYNPSLDNHYYNCIGNDCYMDENGLAYDPEISKQRIVPGKVYHRTKNNSPVSKYWRYGDPGFFGQATRIRPDGTWNNSTNPNAGGGLFRYDLIGVPAYFRFGYFTFGGIIDSWMADNRTSTTTYTVSLSSADSILKNSKVIISKYAGSIFAKIGAGDIAGGPTNYTGYAGSYRGLLSQGNIPNVFNVYGFLESYGFGTSNANDRGIPLSYILDALSVLTSVSLPTANTYQNNLSNIFPNVLSNSNNKDLLGYHSAFSPFGRIICRTMMTDDQINPRPFYIPGQESDNNFSFGVMNPSLDEFGVHRVEFLLDLSEIPRPPIDVRYYGSDGIASINDIIEQACDKSGRDWYTTIVRRNGLNFIKIKTVDRTTTVPTNTVESVIKTLEEASPSIPVTNSSFGKEKNDSAKPRVMYIGGNQQRLFQTKSYLLGYSNTHLVYHPQLKKFVNYYRLCENTSDSNAFANPSLERTGELEGNPDNRRGPTSRDRTNDYIKTINKRDKWTNSYRIPMAYSTRNLLLSNLLNGPIVTQLVANEQAIAEGSSAVAASAFNSVFDKVDNFAIDKPVGGKAIVKLGNYWLTYTESICNPAWYRDSNETESLLSGCADAEDEQVSPDNKPRYIPLWYSSICPFFGYVNDVLVKDNTEKGSNIYRFVRPVYLDTWSGLLVIGFRCNELPALSLGMLPVWYATEMSADGTLITNGSGLQGGNMSGGTPNETPTDPAGADGGESDPPPGEEPEEEEGEEEGEEPTKSDSPDAYSNNYMINNICFTVTESELRAAQSSKEDYLAYCLMKMPYSKPNLFTMLVAQYQSMGKLKVNQVGGSPINNASGLGGGGAAGGGVINVAGGSPVGIVGSRRIGATEALNRNFNWILNPDFMRDWERITNFVKGIADKYYGKEYLVKLPTVLSYRDYQYADLQIPLLVDNSVSMSVYQGSGKIFFNYEITDKAWEEPGNYIDDSIIIGSPQYYQLCDNDGRLTPILGYNATPVKDYIAEKWCSFNNIKQKDQWEKSNAPEAIEYNKIKTKIKDAKDDKQKAFLKYKLRKLEATVVGKMMYDCSLLTVPALDLSKMNDQDYILIMGKDSGREDAYSNMTIGTPITLQNGDTIMDPGGGVLYEVDLEDNPYSENIDEKKEKIKIGEKLPIPTVKAYFTTTCEEAFVFLDPVYLTDPRARITAPGLNLYPPSTSYKTDPTLVAMANMAAEDYGILEGLKKHSVAQGESRAFLKYIDKITEKTKWYIDGEILEDTDDSTLLCLGYFNLKRILLGLFTVLDEQGFLLLEDNTSNQSPGYYTMSERKAHPFFAAVPLKDNVACYGPWTNYPVLGDQRVFPVLATPPIARISLIEQLINDIDIERNPEWCPWEYGGMSFLDREIINQIEAKTSYQIHLENGTLVTHGMPMFNMSAGLRIKTLDSDVYGFYNRMFMNYTYHTLQTRNFITYSGLTLTNISTSVSDRSINTTYKFQTYSPKLGIYSKEISDRNKLSAKTKIAFLSQAGAQIREINSNLTSTFFSILKENSTPKDFSSGDGSKYKGMHRGTSPVQYLVGSASFLVPSNGLPYCGDPGLNSEEYKTLLDSVNPDNLKKEGEYLHTITRTKNWVGAFQTSESLAELSSQYNSKSVMSFDGIFSPVSFYPTYNLGTYSISSRFLSATDRASGLTCPMCNGSSLFTHYRGHSKTPTQYPCPLCSKTKLSVPATLEIDIDSPPDINFKSLNPIIMPTGEFQNPNSQVLTNPLERSRHNIRVIGRQERPIDGDISLDTGDNLGIITDENGNTNKDAIDSGQTLSDTSRLSHYNSDYYQYDLDYGAGSTSESESQEPKTKILQNQRFFALRGPMMLHGWGYDTEGYPVPNQADEPVDFDASGRPKRFLLTSSGTNDYTNDGKFLPGEGESLGDIIGRGYVKEGGEWTRKPTRYFHLNWGERSDLWPIGPIDLRWDEERKVWTGGGGCGEIDPPYIMASGSNPSILNNFITKAKASSEKSCPYKMVYLVLEENLFSDIGMSESYPARAFLDDSEYGLEPLPYTVRRVVYVNDRCGYSAPRGAKLLCRYNRETGFYEPISKPSFIVFGSVSQGSNTATVELAYIRGIKSAENIPKTNISFDNTRFNFNINAGKSRRGMFLFENGKWILTGFN